MTNSITKAVITAAGLGIRSLPASKSIPKEMIPILNVPSMDLIVQEAIDSGVKEILIIVSSTKQSLIDYYHTNHNLEKHLVQKKRLDLLERIKLIGKGAKIRFKFQKEPKGLGDAIRLGKKFTGRDPFVVMLGDNIMSYGYKYPPVTKQLMDVYDKYHQSTIAVETVDKNIVDKYGIIAPGEFIDSKRTLCNVTTMVEKPPINKAPSNLAIVGRYIFTSEIYHSINRTKLGTNGELQITDAIVDLLESQKVYALECKNQCYDIGRKEGLVKITIDYALRDKCIKGTILSYIKQIAKENR
ncbi:MAG: UTP--glucose-1-phosphate uridylyltransferase [Mycoplasmataceae bacterium]|jgi:UTP--glucose-1-phosphate uridylyltransferase|nr:UTP--glucose-1-phosphate uridylyltransferase [Mycoplasmataceae bacterium]